MRPSFEMDTLTTSTFQRFQQNGANVLSAKDSRVNVDGAKSALNQKFLSFHGIFMVVKECAVNFKRNFPFWQKEVHEIVSNLMFLNKRNLQRFERGLDFVHRRVVGFIKKKATAPAKTSARFVAFVAFETRPTSFTIQMNALRQKQVAALNAAQLANAFSGVRGVPFTALFALYLKVVGLSFVVAFFGAKNAGTLRKSRRFTENDLLASQTRNFDLGKGCPPLASGRTETRSIGAGGAALIFVTAVLAKKSCHFRNLSVSDFLSVSRARGLGRVCQRVINPFKPALNFIIVGSAGGTY